ncbi:hypothetical protein ARMGADRAFT_1171799 [Armillaria gallica]|uniref:Uncharacterized protein n=1 Tax=Armillaria gallica TaxID=47427 RepID=A0A2H3CQG6_ARMGA|nr:hypothetical protein ARMGADRAFT_1171799 [Armillaria gallica]
MALNNIKSRDSLPQNIQSAPDSPVVDSHSKAASVPSHWADFYQLPVANDIIAGTKWIDHLWKILHCRDPVSYPAARRLAYASGDLSKDLNWYDFNSRLIELPHVLTKTLYAIYDILEYQGYLQSACPELINDILQEIKDNNSDSMTFSLSLQRRCKVAGPQLEDKTCMLQKVVVRQHKDLNARNLLRFFDYLLWSTVISLIPLCVGGVFLTWTQSVDRDSAIITFVAYALPLGCLVAMMAQSACLCMRRMARRVDRLNVETFRLIWAVRDMAALLTLIAEAECSPLWDVLHGKRFLEAFRASFLGGREELSNIRSRLQELPNWADKNFSAHHWNDYDIASPDNDVL